MEKLQQIIEGCIKYDRNKQSELYRMFASKMYALCLRYAGNSFDAQDILQDGFVKVFNNIKNYRATGSFEGWMKRIFINLALDRFRSSINHLSVDEIADHHEITDKEASAIDNLSEKEILSMVQQLPDQYRMVFNLYVLEGLSHNDIAAMMGIGVSTSRSNLARAKAILKEKIDNNTSWIEKAI